MRNKIKCLLLNLTLLAGVYCNCEYSRCAGCCKNCCGNGEEDSKNENENKILDNNNNQLLKQDNNDINNVINENNNEEEGQKDNKNKDGNIDNQNKESQDAAATYNIIGQNNGLNQQGNLSNNNANGKNDSKENSVGGNNNENNNNKEPEEEKKENNGINDEINEENNVENGEEDNNNENNNNEVIEDNKIENGNNTLDDNNNQLPLQDNVSNKSENLSDNNDNDTNNNEGNNVKNGEGGNNNENNNNKGNEEQKNENKEINNDANKEDAKNQQDLYFKIQGGAIDNNGLGCFGESWVEAYKKKKDDNNNENTILLYKLTEQPEATKGTAGTLVYSKENKKLKYKKDNDLPDDLKDSDNKWAIFKVTTLNKVNNQEQEGESHIFYCSDVSSLSNCGLFEEIECWSIEILAAKTTEVKTFNSMFNETKSSLEQSGTGRSGFIGLDKLDVSGAEDLAWMFNMAFFKQATINSLSGLQLRNNADISYMFFMERNNLSFEALNGWIVGEAVYLRYSSESKYSIFFIEYDNGENSGKLPEWYNDRLLKK